MWLTKKEKKENSDQLVRKEKSDRKETWDRWARKEMQENVCYDDFSILNCLECALLFVAAPSGIGTSGVTYVQWGRKRCSAYGVQTLYSGIAAGSHYTHSGGGANTQCLPLDPIWGVYQDGNQAAGGNIFGSEYQLGHIQMFANKDLDQQNPPCALCYAATKNTQFMLPAKNSCPSGWSRAYYGYLMADYHDHKGRNSYVCVDYYAEGTTASKRNENGNLFYPVEGICGSLPCPPYVNGRELTCCVCMK